MKKQFFIPNEITSNFDRPDYSFPDSETYAIAFKTDKAALEGFLPEGLSFVPGYEDVVLLRINKFECTEKKIRPYWESVISVPASIEVNGDTVIGEYAAQLYLGSIDPESTISPILSGQVLYGYPKREALFSVDGEFGTSDVSVIKKRHGKTLCDVDFKTWTSETPANLGSAVPQGPLLVCKAIPNVRGNGWDVLEINTPGMVDGSLKMKEMRPLEGKINGDIRLDTGRTLPVKEILESYYLKYDWILTWGTTLHNFLK
ncbi:acetoacetate decarboxylase family protein [Winogradskyella vidalii]|uniref:acetoacetate decarboxylase family protein n=1 Tax=Winogradskyella vidalii TaxID=2615024 RepID=UPI0015CB4CB8|nr:acetoacetate decarboxylase family protein [Winogradskyella vidalii]